MKREKDPAWRIAVPDDLPISGLVIRQAVAAIRQAARDAPKHGVVRWQDRYQAKLAKPGKGHLDIAVSKASVSHASRIMQALFSAFERRGFTVRVSENGETVVTILDEPFRVCAVLKAAVDGRHAPGAPGLARRGEDRRCSEGWLWNVFEAQVLYQLDPQER